MKTYFTFSLLSFLYFSSSHQFVFRLIVLQLKKEAGEGECESEECVRVMQEKRMKQKRNICREKNEKSRNNRLTAGEEEGRKIVYPVIQSDPVSQDVSRELLS